MVVVVVGVIVVVVVVVVVVLVVTKKDTPQPVVPCWPLIETLKLTEEIGAFDGTKHEIWVEFIKVPAELIPPKSQTIAEPLKKWFPVTVTLLPGYP